MKIVFLCQYFWPRVGGVENQVLGLSRRLVKLGNQVTVITLKHEQGLKKTAVKAGVRIIRITSLPVKYLGLILIWLQLFKLIRLIKAADIVHAHNVLIWYWPLKILLPQKPVYVTWHGWEGIYPVPFKNIFIRKIDAFIAKKSIAIHDYIIKYYRVKADKVAYPAIDWPRQKDFSKDGCRMVYVGRLDRDTGLPIILRALARLKNVWVDWCGDGPLKQACRRYGPVHGWVDPGPFYQKALICLSAGAASILEAFSYRCLVITAYNNPLKKDYLLMTPFKNWITVSGSAAKLAQRLENGRRQPEKFTKQIDQARDWVKSQSWSQTIKMYQQLWQ